MKVTKAIIMAAGYGTRRLPITKSIEKSMLPIGNRPLIDYVVKDCVDAGIKEIIFVVGENFEQLKTYFGRNQLLEEYLEAKGKHDQLKEAIALSEQAKFHFIVQDQHQPYGTTVPLWLCRDMFEPGEKFLFISGDQFYHHDDGGSETAHFLAQAQKAGTDAAMLVTEVDPSEVYKYGIVKLKTQHGVELFDGIIEKPSIKQAPSNLNNCSFWLFGTDIFEYAQRDMRRERTGEYQITDVANEYASEGHGLAVIRAKGQYLDGGTVEGWLKANNVVLS